MYVIWRQLITLYFRLIIIILFKNMYEKKEEKNYEQEKTEEINRIQHGR